VFPFVKMLRNYTQKMLQYVNSCVDEKVKSFDFLGYGAEDGNKLSLIIKRFKPTLSFFG